MGFMETDTILVKCMDGNITLSREEAKKFNKVIVNDEIELFDRTVEEATASQIVLSKSDASESECSITQGVIPHNTLRNWKNLTPDLFYITKNANGESEMRLALKEKIFVYFKNILSDVHDEYIGSCQFSIPNFSIGCADRNCWKIFPNKVFRKYFNTFPVVLFADGKPVDGCVIDYTIDGMKNTFFQFMINAASNLQRKIPPHLLLNLYSKNFFFDENNKMCVETNKEYVFVELYSELPSLSYNNNGSWNVFSALYELFNEQQNDRISYARFDVSSDFYFLPRYNLQYSNDILLFRGGKLFMKYSGNKDFTDQVVKLKI